MSRASNPDFPTLLESFFTQRMQRQRQVSPNTLAAYRDTFRLLLRFAQEQLRRAPTTLTVAELDAPLVGRFLDYLERARGNGARTRNARLAAVHSFFRYVALEDPTHGAVAQRVLALPSKRTQRRLIAFMTEQEIAALLAAPDLETWAGQRDRALLLLAVQTGLRVSELSSLRVQDVSLGPGAHVRCQGKGRKERCTPLRRDVVRVLRSWLREHCVEPTDPLFPNAQGLLMSRDGFAYLLNKHVATAKRSCPSLRRKRVTPHVLRHYVGYRTMSSEAGCIHAETETTGSTGEGTS